MQEQLLAAMAVHVVFDGWSKVAFAAAVRDVGMSEAEALARYPRGAVDLAVLAHRQGDKAFEQVFAALDWAGVSTREKIARAVRLRLEVAGDREALRSATALFALPHRTVEGAALIWGTVDHIWQAVGDTATDGNWYSKRMTLAAVYSAALLYWLGDESEGRVATDAFLQRRIAEVLQIEKAKAHPAFAPVRGLLERIAAPVTRGNLPGRW